jgi:hypothetical protein
VKRFSLLAISGLLAAGAAATPAYADSPRTSSDQIVGVVHLIDGETAQVQARYSCTGTPDQLHLWVSVKQSANGTADPGLAEEGTGYGQKAIAWSQGHGAVSNLVCDGHTHVSLFTVDRSEYGYGTLQKGDAYVQFCMFDATTPVEGPEGQPISSMQFVHVR